MANKEGALARGERNAFKKQEIVCSHIHKALDAKKVSINIFPLCTQIYGDSYHLFWYCNQCAEKYKLPIMGVYIYGAEEDMGDSVGNGVGEKLPALDNFLTNNSSDCHPFENFIQKETKNTLPRERLKSNSVGFSETPLMTKEDIIKIPFCARE